MASSRFLAYLREQAETHIRKSAGYAGKDNPDTWANFREAERLALTPLQGCMVRLSDKFIRACNLMRDASNDQVGESLRDTLIDLGNYAGIAVCLLDEQRLGPEEPIWPGPAFVIGSPEYDGRLAMLRLTRDGADIRTPETIAPLLTAIDNLLATAVLSPDKRPISHLDYLDTGVIEQADPAVGLPWHCTACGADFAGSYAEHQQTDRHRTGAPRA